jgi:hypothetical protein
MTRCTNFHAAALIPALKGLAEGSNANERIRAFE